MLPSVYKRLDFVSKPDTENTIRNVIHAISSPDTPEELKITATERTIAVLLHRNASFIIDVAEVNYRLNGVLFLTMFSTKKNTLRYAAFDVVKSVVLKMVPSAKRKLELVEKLVSTGNPHTNIPLIAVFGSTIDASQMDVQITDVAFTKEMIASSIRHSIAYQAALVVAEIFQRRTLPPELEAVD